VHYTVTAFGLFLYAFVNGRDFNRCLQFISMFTGDGPSLRGWKSLGAIVRRKALVMAAGTILLVAGIPALAQREPGGTTGLPNTEVNPIPTTSGTLGLFTLETGELLESGWSVSAYGNRFTRMPGSVIVSNYGLTV
jgi:hypothetical protein